jgi:hypothetical protein
LAGAGKLLPSDAPYGPCDFGSDWDHKSEMGKVPLSRRRFEWETVETWNREVLEDCHIQDCILNNVQQFMRGAGLSFVAGQKKKLKNLDCWTLQSKKLDKDKIYKVTIGFQIKYFSFHISVLDLPIAITLNRFLCMTVLFRASTTAIVLPSCEFHGDPNK